MCSWSLPNPLLSIFNKSLPCIIPEVILPGICEPDLIVHFLLKPAALIIYIFLTHGWKKWLHGCLGSTVRASVAHRNKSSELFSPCFGHGASALYYIKTKEGFLLEVDLKLLILQLN